ncbi:hypothetical protein KY329_00425 [Candidatus Woesearchaeota archaeon]|nr:hypothetical protein [Candidatus Woesearchaeota archaeon]
MNLKKLSGLIAIIIIVAVSLLAVFRLVPWTYFWIIAAVIAAFAWWVLPRMR